MKPLHPSGNSFKLDFQLFHTVKQENANFERKNNGTVIKVVMIFHNLKFSSTPKGLKLVVIFLGWKYHVFLDKHLERKNSLSWTLDEY